MASISIITDIPRGTPFALLVKQGDSIKAFPFNRWAQSWTIQHENNNEIELPDFSVKSEFVYAKKAVIDAISTIAGDNGIIDADQSEMSFILSPFKGDSYKSMKRVFLEIEEKEDESDDAKKEALKVAVMIGCRGVHRGKNGEWLPCSNEATLNRISNFAETDEYLEKYNEKKQIIIPPQDKKARKRFRKNRKVKKRRRDEWENLRLRGVVGIDSIDAGIVSAPVGGAGMGAKSLGAPIGAQSVESQRDGDGDGMVALTPGGPDDTPVRNRQRLAKGQIQAGNIDLNNRPIVKNPDGTISTVRSITITEGGRAVVIPTVIRGKNGKGKVVSDNAAIAHYKKSGEHLGKFKNISDADRFANSLHEQQARQYSEKSARFGPEYVRDNDPDVFTDPESARARSRQLGCIGISRRVSKTGKTVWMPCTNMSDYSRVAGTTSLGRRRNVAARQSEIRRVVQEELRAAQKKK